MATPGKVSLKKKNRKLFTARVLTDEEDFEKENSDVVGSLGTFRSRNKSNRRNSTILAGNLSILNQEDDSDQILSPNVTQRRKRIQSSKPLEEANVPPNDLLTEDESSFYSCDESLNRNQVFLEKEKDPWMTELTEHDDKCKTPSNKVNHCQTHGEDSFPRPTIYLQGHIFREHCQSRNFLFCWKEESFVKG